MSVIITVNHDNTCDIELISSYNNDSTYQNYSYKWEDVPFIARKGKLHVTGSNTTASYIKLSYINTTYDRENWLFGDSYFNMTEANRWTSYLVTNNHYNSSYLNGYTGRSSLSALQSLKDLLHIRIPKRVVWCLGMNDSDGASTINANYKNAVDQLIALSKQYGFELILSTIPNTPVNNNVYKNQFVRNSGYRYIDFSTSVGANSANSTWYSNCLSEDNIHPTIKGATLLYGRAMADVPELY